MVRLHYTTAHIPEQFWKAAGLTFQPLRNHYLGSRKQILQLGISAAIFNIYWFLCILLCFKNSTFLPRREKRKEKKLCYLILQSNHTAIDHRGFDANTPQPNTRCGWKSATKLSLRNSVFGPVKQQYNSNTKVDCSELKWHSLENIYRGNMDPLLHFLHSFLPPSITIAYLFLLCGVASFFNQHLLLWHHNMSWDLSLCSPLLPLPSLCYWYKDFRSIGAGILPPSLYEVLCLWVGK